MLGCGSSRLSEEMFDDGKFILYFSNIQNLFVIVLIVVGYESIMNIDFSKVVIEQNIIRYKEKPGLQWQQMNATSLEFPDQTFDTVIAKATFDAVLCGEGSTSNIARMCSEVSRVLKSNGLFFIISYGVTDNRLSYLEKPEYGWKVGVFTIPKPTINAAALPASDETNGVHYVYICKKQSPLAIQE
jgi:ubiquinone/menaquinone biosynthesis C-methylase UbiE